MQKIHVIHESTQIINEGNQSDLKTEKRCINAVTLVPDFAKRRVNLPILVKNPQKGKHHRHCTNIP